MGFILNLKNKNKNKNKTKTKTKTKRKTVKLSTNYSSKSHKKWKIFVLYTTFYKNRIYAHNTSNVINSLTVKIEDNDRTSKGTDIRIFS